MHKDVEQFISTCAICQTTNYSTQPPTGMLQPLPIPTKVWDHITMDFITCLPLSQGFSVILVFVDRLTKYIHLGALPAQFNAHAVARFFVLTVIMPHGFITRCTPIVTQYL